MKKLHLREHTFNTIEVLFFTISFTVFSVLFLTMYSTPKTSALSGGDFNAGRIIDDAVFYNNNSMSPQQIQQFLNSKVPACDTNGTQMYNSTQTRAQWAASNGKPLPPYTCLKNYNQNVPTVTNGGSDLCKNSISGGTKSAAQIIWDAAQACGINPQVLIVMLQKEQSLITDNWPWPIQYNTAMGYACPDSGPNNSANCNSNFFGFFNQVYDAAKAYRRYEANPTSYNYRAGRNNYVLYNPNTACGGTTIFIENQATANLYIYTPYQPNAAALNNLYGTGDGCSAYGNRNFWRMFNDWFGSTYSIKPYTNISWNFEYLDGSSEGVSPNPNTVGVEPETIVFNNKLYVFYYDSTDGNLVLSYADSNGWSNEILDGNGGVNGRVDASVGRMTSSAVHNNELHITYYDQTNSTLRYGVYSPSTDIWTFITLDGSEDSISGYMADVGYGSTIMSHGTSLQLFYYDKTFGNLRHAWLNPDFGWRFENLDGDYGSVARYNSDIGQSPVAISHTNGIQLFYYDAGHGNLRHAWTTPTGWKFEKLDGDPTGVSRQTNNVGSSVDAYSLGAGGLQVYYYDSTGGNLRHAWTTPTGWKFEDLDGTKGSVSRQSSNTGMHPNISYLNDTLYVFYKDVGAGSVRYAWANSLGWNFATLEGGLNTTSGSTNHTGLWPSSAVFGESMQLYYFDNTERALRHTWGNPL